MRVEVAVLLLLSYPTKRLFYRRKHRFALIDDVDREKL